MRTKAKPTIKQAPFRPTRLFTSQQIEHRLVAVLGPALHGKSGHVFTFAEWTLPGHGVVLRLSSGQEFCLSITEAAH